MSRTIGEGELWVKINRNALFSTSCVDGFGWMSKSVLSVIAFAISHQNIDEKRLYLHLGVVDLR